MDKFRDNKNLVTLKNIVPSEVHSSINLIAIVCGEPYYERIIYRLCEENVKIYKTPSNVLFENITGIDLAHDSVCVPFSTGCIDKCVELTILHLKRAYCPALVCNFTVSESFLSSETIFIEPEHLEINQRRKHSMLLVGMQITVKDVNNIRFLLRTMWDTKPYVLVSPLYLGYSGCSIYFLKKLN
jgi:hypothetical protein